MPFFDQYPYTNFHNVNLDWVLERVKEWGELVEQNNIAFQNLEQANEDFKSYVTNYLENLDVQAQIDDKLDRMFESGELTDYLQPYVSSTVTTWLDENITEPTGVVIDASLTVAGACADAKATGDAINNLIPDTLSLKTRNLLLSMFSKIGFITDSAYTLYSVLENNLISDALFSFWEYDSRLNDTDRNKIYRLPSYNMPRTLSDGSFGVEYVNAPANIASNNRRSFCIYGGRFPMVNYTDGSLSTFYPIPVPETAHKVTVSIFPSNQQLCTYLYKYVGFIEHGNYQYRNVSPQPRVYVTGVDSFEFEPSKNLYISFVLRRDASNTQYTDATEPEMNILFE